MGQPTAPDYTWQQSLKYFTLGLVYTCAGSCLPAAAVILKSARNHTHHDWILAWEVFSAAAVPLGNAYWQSHKNLLKWPPFFQIPADFLPTKVTTEHTTQVITPATAETAKVVETLKETKETVLPPEKGQ